RDFAADFAAALEAADLAWVMPVYAAREDPDPATTARTITGHGGEAVVALDADAQVLDLVPAAARPGDLLKVTILEHEMRVPYGVVSNRPGRGALPGEYPAGPGTVNVC
uniref:hypothetical protein n=1 Tax=Picosynechococcus sp. (strain ATCC 27264 / PCC 7002 / PR-6) TaxID=32049 RepID=UPI0030D9D0C6